MKKLAPLAAIVFVMAAASSASGAITIGQSAGSYAATGCGNCGGFEIATASGTGYTVPSDGVITSYAIRTSTSAPSATDIVHFMVLRAAGGTSYTVVHHGAAQSFAGRAANTLESFPAQVTVKAGDFIGNAWSTNSVNPLFSAPGPNEIRTSTDFSTAPAGATITATNPSIPGTPRLNLVASLEADADHDGFGDETQDLCPTDPTEHGPCTPPVISGFKLKPSKFAVNTKGVVISGAKIKKGSAIALTLSKAANVSFVVSLKGKGRKVGGKCVAPTKKNATKKSCTYYPLFHSFSRDLPAGANTIAYSGRYKKGSKKKSLPAGAYVITAYPFNIPTQIGGGTAKTSFKIVSTVKH